MNELLIFAVIAVIFGIIKTILQPSARTLKTYLTVMLVSVPVGMISGGLALEYSLGDYTALALASIASLMAEGIVRAFIDNKAIISKALNNLVDKYTK